MYPILLEWGNFIIPAWHALFAGGAIAAYFLLIYLTRKHFSKSISEIDIGWVFGVAYIGGYFGARLFSIFVEQAELSPTDKFFALFQLGPMTFYGGMAGAACAGVLFTKLKGMSLPDVADMALPSGLLGLAVGRIGCFLNGDDYGIAVAPQAGDGIPWWAVVFPNHLDPIPRVPVQLIESFVVLVILALSLKYFAKMRRVFFPGVIALGCGALYALSRFMLEYLRGDPRGPFMINGMFSPSQMVSILLLILCNVIFVVTLLRSNETKKPCKQGSG